MIAFLSVYACEPGKGSEPEVGWRVATGMASHCKVRAITRANNREAIEAGLAEMDGAKPEFLYYDLPAPFLKLKKRILGTSGYYILWQIAARWHFRKELESADLIHHVTFNGVQFPGLWFNTGKPVVLGSLGGGMTCPSSLLPLFGKHAAKEKRRSLLIRSLHLLPWWRETVEKATTVIAANRETADLLQPHRSETVPVLLETAVFPEMITNSPRPTRDAAALKILWLGQMIPRKAPLLALQAFAKALESEPDLRLTIAGPGPEEERVRAEALRLGITDKVEIPGRVPKERVNSLMDETDAFLFTSIRDTSGNVVLEAMSRGVPVIALHHQGIREICDPDSSLLVEPSSISETIQDFAEAMIRLKREDGLAQRLGTAGIERVAKLFTWPNYCERMMEFYQASIESELSNIHTNASKPERGKSLNHNGSEADMDRLKNRISPSNKRG
ncbi:MAG: glycosyltransferase family 4 protein [Luteolibacter sp.]